MQLKVDFILGNGDFSAMTYRTATDALCLCFFVAVVSAKFKESAQRTGHNRKL